ncbi:MAG: hypothetical protein N4A40_06560 [Tissierellales bacterium]|jgi:hypothetical protein|nr:hypothetical protein [Tissierellales bacterium]
MKQHLEIKDLKLASEEQLLKIQNWYFEDYKKQGNYIQADIIASEGKDIPLLTIGQIVALIDNMKLDGYKIEKTDNVYVVKSSEKQICESELIDALWKFFAELS